MTALQKYQTIYACFNEVAFVWPRVFYHMFFGNHHVDLGQVISTYYKVLYPEELQTPVRSIPFTLNAPE